MLPLPLLLSEQYSEWTLIVQRKECCTESQSVLENPVICIRGGRWMYMLTCELMFAIKGQEIYPRTCSDVSPCNTIILPACPMRCALWGSFSKPSRAATIFLPMLYRFLWPQGTTTTFWLKPSSCKTKCFQSWLGQISCWPCWVKYQRWSLIICVPVKVVSQSREACLFFKIVQCTSCGALLRREPYRYIYFIHSCSRWFTLILQTLSCTSRRGLQKSLLPSSA